MSISVHVCFCRMAYDQVNPSYIAQKFNFVQSSNSALIFNIGKMNPENWRGKLFFALSLGKTILCAI